MFLFALVAMARWGREVIAELGLVQKTLLLGTAVYVLAWGTYHGDMAVWITTISWLLAIAMVPASLGFAAGGGLSGEGHWKLLGLAAIVHVLLFLLALYLLWDTEDYPWTNRTPGFNNIRHLTYLLVPAAVVAGTLHMTQSERRLWPLISFAAAVFYLFLTGARGGVFAVTLALPMMLVICRVMGGVTISGRVVQLATLYLALLGIVAAIPDLPFDSIWARAESLAQGGTVTGGRWGVWTASAEAIRDNWLFGVGPVALGNIQGPTEEFALNHPHNLLFQILLNWGVLGSALLIATGAALAVRVFDLDRTELADRCPALAAILGMFIHALVDGGLYYLFSVAIFLIAFVVLIRPSERLQAG
ncbi:MAG: O-antigen ligase family protein [Pseudomonadota bacterium]